MRITDLREQPISLRSDIRNSWISFNEMDCSLVAVVSDQVRDGRRVVGYGFNSNGRYAQSQLIKGRFRTRLLEADVDDLLNEAGDNFDPERISAVLLRNEKPGGHGDRAVAIGAIDMAIHDLVAKIAGLPLYEVLARRVGRDVIDRDVFVYAAGGYYSDGNHRLADELHSYLDLGYTHVKMKIGGAPLKVDLERIDTALGVVGHDASRLAVDANGRLDREQALAYAKALEPLGLMWYEEPCDPLDFKTLQAVAAVYGGKLATGENLFARQEVEGLLAFGGLRPEVDVLQVDPALAYGLVEYEKILKLLREAGWTPAACIPHGGHQLALHAAVGYGLGGNESYPGIFAPFGGFADGAAIVDGRITVSDEPGIGIEQKAELFKLCRDLAA